MCQHPVRHCGGVLGPRRGGAAVSLLRGGEADDDAECDGGGRRRPGPDQRARPQPAEPPARAGRGRADAAHTAQREPQHQLRRLLLIRIGGGETCYPLRYQ